MQVKRIHFPAAGISGKKCRGLGEGAPLVRVFPQRIDEQRLREQKALRDKGYLTILEIPGGFDEPRVLMGEEELCIACYEEPELLHDILDTITDTCIEVIRRVGETVPIDCLFVHEDMAGKSGPLFGPAQVREKYGNRLCVKGGIDKFALHQDKEAIRKELEYRLAPSLRGGGAIFGLDHRIPNGVHIENYRYYVNLGREMLGLEPITGEGWQRMAF